MGGGLMQLVAYGAQDIYLTGNPQITFWKVVYRRHTNFACESIEQTWNGSATADGRCTATISRNGDLVHNMYLEVGGTTADCLNPGASWIKDIAVEIGGQQIDKHTGAWLEAYAELNEPNPTGMTATLTENNAAAPTGLTRFQGMAGMGGVDGATVASNFTVPLRFWFNRNPGLALPLIALQYHEVKVVLNHICTTCFTANQVNKLWCDYIYLDTDERRRFAQVSHEYLIEQVQEQTLSAATTNDLILNHPVKELIWGCTVAASGSVDYAAFSEPLASNVDTFQLKLNGHDRFAARRQSYFSRTQVYEHHSGYGGLDSSVAAGVGEANDGLCVFSFALEPEEHQPSGTCNFSRIDTAQLVSSTAVQTRGVLFAVNYNVLRIMSGMGGLAYSN
jgi:hypothetical protein